ncbi:phospholipase d1 [Niveomyces insectorum RCEF 264]|uniref:Phospholipase d1 n=1 Tax=Niveomyces insectorum RCEF 264 TaxID=1081102 RepID=A0A167YR63_9HYPO|nr:phospholipase d1 [Niveomyces insectorum RCEF 264]
MKFFAAALFASTAAAAAAAAAASTTAVSTGSSSSCAAQNILEACLDTENTQLNNCGTSDWDCKCNAYGNIVTCYNNCPNDPTISTVKGQQQIFCGYASQYPSATPTGATKTGGAAEATAPTTGATGAGSSPSASKTTGGSDATHSPSGTATPNSGTDLVLNAGSMLVAVAGMMAALL